MVEMDGYEYGRYADEARKSLDSIDPELWQRFSWINPVRFYRLKENAEGIARALSSSRPLGIRREDEGTRQGAIALGLARVLGLEPRRNGGD
jgi:hypothetical protein